MSKLINNEHHSSERLALPFNESKFFKIISRPCPVLRIVLHIVGFVVVGGIASVLMFKYTDKSLIITLIPFLATLFISTVYSLAILIEWKKDSAKGDRFIYDKHSHVIHLPRYKVKLQYSSDIFLEIVTGWVGNAQQSKVSELHLVDKTEKDKVKRWCIATSASSFTNAFDYILEDLYNETHIKIRGGKKKWY
jgi:hypothetical protein